MKNCTPAILITILLLCCNLFFNVAFAQDPSIKQMQANATKKIEAKIDSGKTWKTGGIFNLNFGQGSQSNWAAGGDDFSLFIAFLFWCTMLFIEKKRYSWDNTTGS